MNYESKDPFHFEIPEKKPNSLFIRVSFFLLAIFFLIVPLYSIDRNVFKINDVVITIECSHDFCKSNSSCLLTSH